MSKENVTYKVTLKEVMYKELESGAVIVYKLVNDDYNLPLSHFYIATFDDTSSEEAFGLGPTPEAALEYAAKAWDRYDNPENPFREILAQLQK